MHIGYVPRERPPFSALNFRSGAYNFHKLPKNPFRSITILHFLADFAVPETIIFKISNFNPFIAFHGRLSPNAKPSAARVSGRSGDSHFHAQNGSARSGAPHFHASSKRLKLVPEPHIFTLIFLFAAAHTYQNLGWGGGGAKPLTIQLSTSGRFCILGSHKFRRHFREGHPC